MKRLKKGFSLVEGVIALAVIVIISAAVTTLCIYGAKTTPKLYAKFQASNIAADVVTCFDMACEESSTSERNTAMEGYLYFYVSGNSTGDITGTVDSDDSDVYTYSFTIESVKANVTADFSSSEETVTIKTYYNNSDSVLYEYEYPSNS